MCLVRHLWVQEKTTFWSFELETYFLEIVFNFLMISIYAHYIFMIFRYLLCIFITVECKGKIIKTWQAENIKIQVPWCNTSTNLLTYVDHIDISHLCSFTVIKNWCLDNWFKIFVGKFTFHYCSIYPWRVRSLDLF